MSPSHVRRVGLGLLMLAISGPAGAMGQEARPPADATWYTVGDLGVDPLARARGSPVVASMQESRRLREFPPRARLDDAGREGIRSLPGRLSQLMNALPPIDPRPDGVLASLFGEGILLFNRGERAVTVGLTMPAGRWDVESPAPSRNVTLPPLAIRRVAGRRAADLLSPECEERENDGV